MLFCEVRHSNKWIIIRVSQGTSRQGGLTWKIFKFRGRGGKLIGFNGQFLAKSPKFCLKFFFNKNHNFLKIFAEILLKSQRGTKGNCTPLRNPDYNRKILINKTKKYNRMKKRKASNRSVELLIYILSKS
jgi:hypothetical protein